MILPGRDERKALANIPVGEFREAGFAVSRKGRQTTDTFLTYLHFFVTFATNAGIEFPVILFVDDHKPTSP